MSLDRPADGAAAHPAGPVPADDGLPPQDQDREQHEAEVRATDMAWCQSEWARGKVLEGTPGERYLAREHGFAGP